MQVISPVNFHEGFVDPAEATAAAVIINDEVYNITQKYPKRFSGFTGLACQDPDAAAKELERAVKELGLKGAMIYSHIQGEYLDAKKIWVPVLDFLHAAMGPDRVLFAVDYPAESNIKAVKSIESMSVSNEDKEVNAYRQQGDQDCL